MIFGFRLQFCKDKQSGSLISQPAISIGALWFLVVAIKCEINLGEPQAAIDHLNAIEILEFSDKFLLVRTMIQLNQLDKAHGKPRS